MWKWKRILVCGKINMQYGSQYDTVNDSPLIPGETGMVEQLSFKKLSVDTKKLTSHSEWSIWYLTIGRKKE